MLTGVAILILGVISSVRWRRPGQTVRSLFWAGSDLAAHPERYVRADRVRMICVVNMTGVLLWLLGVLLIVRQTIARLV
jgi:hypothetical protein